MPRIRDWEEEALCSIPWMSDRQVRMLDRLSRECARSAIRGGTFQADWEEAARKLVLWVTTEEFVLNHTKTISATIILERRRYPRHPR